MDTSSKGLKHAKEKSDSTRLGLGISVVGGIPARVS